MKFDNSIAYLKLDFITPSKTLDLSGEPLTLEQIKELIKAIKENLTVAKLDLSHCALTDKSLEKLAKFLKTDEHLIELNISNNSFDSEGTHKLSDALENNSTLQVLNVENNFGSVNLINALSNNTTLQILNLNNPKKGEHENLDVYILFPPKYSLHQLTIDGTFHLTGKDIYIFPKNTIGGHVTKLHYITSNETYFPAVPVFPLLTHVTIECSKIFGLSKFLEENKTLEHAEIIFNSSPDSKQIEARHQSNLKSLIIITNRAISDPSISTQLIKFCKSFSALEKLDLTQVKLYNIDSDIVSQLETLFTSKSFVHIGFPIIYPKETKDIDWNNFFKQLNISYKKIMPHNKTLNFLSICQSPHEMTDALSCSLDEINTLKKINLLISYNANTLLNKIASSHLESADIHFSSVKITESHFQSFTKNTSLTHINITSDSIDDQSLIDRLNENLSKICDENKLLKAPLAYLWHLLIKANGLFEEEQNKNSGDNVAEKLEQPIPDGKQEITIVNSGHQSAQFKEESTNQKSALEIYRDLLSIILWYKKINHKMEHYFYSHELTIRLSAKSSLFSNSIFTDDPNAIEKKNRLERELQIINILKSAINSIYTEEQAIEMAILETIKFHACLGIIYAEGNNLEVTIFCTRLALEITDILNRLGHPIDEKSKELLYDAIEHLINQTTNNISDLSIETVYHLSLLFTSSEIWEHSHVKFAIANFIALLSNSLLKTRVDDQRLIFLLLQDATWLSKEHQPIAELLKKQAYLHFLANTAHAGLDERSLEGIIGVEKIITLDELFNALKENSLETAITAFSDPRGLPALFANSMIQNLLIKNFETVRIGIFEEIFFHEKSSSAILSLNNIAAKFLEKKLALITEFESLPNNLENLSKSEKYKKKNTIPVEKQEITIENIPPNVPKKLQSEDKSNDHSKEMKKNFDMNGFFKKNEETLKKENETLEKTKKEKIELIEKEIKRLKNPIISKLPFLKSPEQKIEALENLKTLISAATNIESIEKFITTWKEENKEIMGEPRNPLRKIKHKDPDSQDFLSKIGPPKPS